MRTPGFVDLQVNGYLNVSFSSEKHSAADFADITRKLIRNGTAAFLPTVITSAETVYERNLPLLAAMMDAEEFVGRLPGFHIEGPFISPQPGAIGAHTPAWVKEPDPAFLDKLQELARGKIKLLTVAADVPGMSTFIRHACGMGITVSLGHQLATATDLARAAEAGATALTHLGNGMPNTVDRHDNSIWAGLAEERLIAMLITDGHHLPEAVLRSMLRAKGVERLAVVSDASSLAGMPPGKYAAMNNECVMEASGKLWNPSKGCLVGSSATMLACMNHLHSLGMYDLKTLLTLGIDAPLKLIGLDRDAIDCRDALTFSSENGFAID